MISIKQTIYDALVKKYEAEILQSEATLSIYFSNPVGIGEHPQIIDEIDKLISKLDESKGKLETITEFYSKMTT